MDASSPQKIDRFTILSVLGRGSQGIVYLADDPELNRKVAIKSVALRNNLQVEGDINQLLTEAKTVSRIQHANIVSIFDIGMHHNSPYLVFEYIDGQSLQQLIDTQPSLDQKTRIMRDILSGVAAAHEQDIIHCDIKPANILITQQGKAKVADFGLAMLTDAVKGPDDVLFEHMQNKEQATQLKENAVQSLFGALVANDLALSLGIKNHEEAFLCTLLQQLGKMLVGFYLHEESQAIDRLVIQQQCSEDTAVIQVLGTSYHRLGMAVAKEWGFPDLITDSMRPLNFDSLPPAKDTSTNLQLIAQFSFSLGQCLGLPLEQQASSIKTLTQKFSKVLKVDGARVSTLIENNQKELTQFSKLIQFDMSKSQFFQQFPTNAGKEPVVLSSAPVVI